MVRGSGSDQNSLAHAIVIAIVLFAGASCATSSSGEIDCVRTLSDDQIRGILEELDSIRAPFKASINWVDCEYYVAIWELPVTPDTQKIVVLDRNGNLIEGPR